MVILVFSPTFLDLELCFGAYCLVYDTILVPYVDNFEHTG